MGIQLIEKQEEEKKKHINKNTVNVNMHTCIETVDLRPCINASIMCTHSHTCTNIDTQYIHEHENHIDIDKQYIHAHDEKNQQKNPIQNMYQCNETIA